MKLFYALEFDTPTKDSLVLLQQDLVSSCPKCHFTPAINLHLTLCFLGEIEGHCLTILKEILFSIETEPISLHFNQLGIFPKRRADILWLGIEDNRNLMALQKELAYTLRANNFLQADQTFTPHVTLARGSVSRKLPALERVAVVSSKITLMHSHQKQNILTYTPLSTKQLYQTPII